MTFSPLIDELIMAFQALPGVGPKSAQRMAFFLLQKQPAKGVHLANSLLKTINSIERCLLCQNLAEQEHCNICVNPKRDLSLLCVVESPVDVLSIEQAGGYKGLYFVLMGHLSPIDGIGADELGVTNFIHRLQAKELQEVILATSTTVEGETTAHYFANLVTKYGIKASRIALGAPIGGELENLDAATLTRSLAMRSDFIKNIC